MQGEEEKDAEAAAAGIVGIIDVLCVPSRHDTRAHFLFLYLSLSLFL
jgi:hypothetical protein